MKWLPALDVNVSVKKNQKQTIDYLFKDMY